MMNGYKRKYYDSLNLYVLNFIGVTLIHIATDRLHRFVNGFSCTNVEIVYEWSSLNSHPGNIYVKTIFGKLKFDNRDRWKS